MNKPTVCAVMLVNGREEMVKRAIRSFKSQTYARKHLLIYDTTPIETTFLDHVHNDEDVTIRESQAVNHHGLPKTIGYLRNRGNFNAVSDIIAHFDSDDWSHPNRITEQVDLLQSSGKECVGYREMLFWDAPGQFCHSYLFSDGRPHYALGTSLCYWRKVWERRPFEDLPSAERPHASEDTLWIQGVDTMGMLSGGNHAVPLRFPDEPRMIASVSERMAPNVPLMLKSGDLERAPEWDSYCRERMQL